MQKKSIIKKITMLYCIFAITAVISSTVIAEEAKVPYIAVEAVAEELGYEVYTDEVLNCYIFIHEKNHAVVQTVGEDFWVDTAAHANYYTGNTYIDTDTGKFMVPVGMIESAFGISLENSQTI